MNSSSKLLQGKRTLVTGAGKGIGKSIALAFAENGSDVALVSRTKKDVDLAVSEVKSLHNVKAHPISADVSTMEGAAMIVKQASEALGGIDIVVCAAGYPLIAKIWDESLHRIDEADILRIFEADVLGSFRVIKDAIPLMIAQDSGVVILFSSTPAISGYDKGGAYTLSKAANLGLVKAIAAEYGRYNIRAYAIAPGNIRTERTFDHLSRQEKEALANEASMKRWGTPSEVADVAVALASGKMGFVTGQTIVVDGGTVMT
ncbi:MAG: SDR family NAD(P)-dependent oxidoreductase [Nitrososphaerales archaeon]